jgi:class 3 adenylate cyclase
MSAGGEQRKLAAIMFTDMVGYSALAQRKLAAISFEALMQKVVGPK